MKAVIFREWLFLVYYKFCVRDFEGKRASWQK